ncbi:protein-glutamate O-methyltransferase CheR [Dasania sp. GY-MA-18]|uniref:protein-glutamate O-methyltransferase n=1 Tax=Dasania phycosphaerae TaxID=2950436 RepID=A0A9J6RKQ6_9GAMM|nr:MULTISPECIES: protein-glutamate O-methyltransferase CheR [Dasania]MCR8922145.1 protein-glutamate O-methyltransferase CheR [Dasania sp. GY-MA-18]MCZ0864573.1 protein-glutamate O-methyltransferase CheR [Dasania phycosphaerae]MCZ0868301.1 protein-glutamate O-methyltransferase CheR [Dasania phycosphaerae]
MASWAYEPLAPLSDKQYEQWQALLEQRTGICFMQHRSILQAGLVLRMREIGISDYDEYFQQVSAVPQGAIEWSLLVDRISVKETSFFRDADAFNAVKQFLLNRLDAQQRPQDDTLEIWSVGCSTGEEAYSLAMVASDMVDYTQAKIFIGVTATDISSTALSYARRGAYAPRKLERMPAETKIKYFSEQEDKHFQVVPSLKQKLCFTQGNILELEQAPAIKMDIIYCQNVLIYFQRWRHKQILDMFAERLKPGGLLVMGAGEVTQWNHPKMKRLADERVLAYLHAHEQ